MLYTHTYYASNLYNIYRYLLSTTNNSVDTYTYFSTALLMTQQRQLLPTTHTYLLSAVRPLYFVHTHSNGWLRDISLQLHPIFPIMLFDSPILPVSKSMDSKDEEVVIGVSSTELLNV